MIHIDRSLTPPPSFYNGKEWHYLYKRPAEEFYNIPEKERSQSRFEFQDPDKVPRIKEALIAAFNGKCAYTETRFRSPDDCVIIRHRPQMGAVGLGSENAREHYWWLAYEWDNLIPVLAECARAKGHYFPVEGERAQPGMPLNETIQFEKALLPNPNEPGPAKTLDFEDNGTVSSATKEGEIIIEILGLNTDRAVAGRLQALQQMESEWPTDFLDIPKYIPQFFLNGTEYLECKTQWVDRRLSQMLLGIPNGITRDIQQTLQQRLQKFPESILQVDRLSSFTSIDEPIPASTIKTKLKYEEEDSPELIQAITIERIEVKNFRGIDSMILDLPQEKDTSPNGLMVLGENGSGKSSILQAVTLALEEPEALEDHPFLKVDKVLRRGQESGYVKLHLTDHKNPVEVAFQKGESSFHFSGPRSGLSFFLRAYGPHRILPEDLGDDQLVLKRANIANKNLWNPYEALVDAEKWILQLSDDAFDAFALALKDLLNLKENGFITRDEGSLRFDIGEKELALDDLSSGYKTIIATAADIIAGYPIDGTDMKIAPGIVLIDEIGAHLHPSWRMRIVKAYRNTFSSIQFITTTHEPLCLRGLRQNEIVVLQRQGRSVEKIEQLPNLEQMRIDQILTSPVFGMNTTVDPLVEEQFTEYYAILATENPSAKDLTRAKELKHILYRYGVLGTDRRSRAIYDIIDKELATQTKNNESKPISRKSRKRILDLWDNSGLEFES